jgi:hypothetical protein
MFFSRSWDRKKDDEMRAPSFLKVIAKNDGVNGREVIFHAAP